MAAKAGKRKRRTFGRRLMKPVDKKAAAVADGCVIVVTYCFERCVVVNVVLFVFRIVVSFVKCKV